MSNVALSLAEQSCVVVNISKEPVEADGRPLLLSAAQGGFVGFSLYNYVP